jgi:hypothetical protein
MSNKNQELDPPAAVILGAEAGSLADRKKAKSPNWSSSALPGTSE